MQIKTTVTKQIFDVHENEVKINDTVLISTADRDIAALFDGYAKNGALAFHSIVEDKVFHIMPSTIRSIFPVEIKVKGKKDV